MLKKGERCPEEWGSFVIRSKRSKNHKERRHEHTDHNVGISAVISRYALAQELSPEELQNVMSQWSAWYDRLVARGKIKSAQPLADEGKVVAWKKGQTVADGPFAESKEAIGGYFLLENVDMEESLEIAKECPMLKFGVTVEVRPVALQCASLQKSNRRFAEVTA